MTTVKLKFRLAPNNQLRVSLTASHCPTKETEGYLSGLPSALEASFTQWQINYRQLDEIRQYIAPQPGLRLSPKTLTISSPIVLVTEVKTHLNEWLNCGDREWQPIRDSLISIAHQLSQTGDEEPQIIIDANDISLLRLPWQEWDLLEQYYPAAEIALCIPKSNLSESSRIQPQPASSCPRILLVVGRSDQINTQSDLAIIEQLKEYNAEVISLIQPSRKELCEALWDEKGYHIFVFTGHSGSTSDGQIGWIEINNHESISIEEFKNALKEAISKGLQLAIFNSCDGLGLAYQLIKLNLPQSIVMREPVPDEVAIEFLKHFFKELTKHKSLFVSVLKARKRLEHFNSKYPGANWLPTLCLKSSIVPFLWASPLEKMIDSLPKNDVKPTQFTPKTFFSKSLGMTSIASVLVGFLVGIGSLSLGSQLLLSSQSSTVPQMTGFSSISPVSGNWRYGGSTTWAPIRGLVDRKIKEKFLDYQLIYTQHPMLPEGSGTGIQMLLKGQLSFAQSSRPISESEFESAARQKITLRQVPVAIDGIAIAVNPALKIRGLTLEELREIYTGKITNWQQLGSENLAIIPYSRPLNSGTTEFFKENIINQQAFTNKVVEVKTTTEALRAVSQNKGAIYYASAAEVVGQCSIKPIPISYRLGSAFITPYRDSYIPPEQCSTETKNTLNYNAFQNSEYPLTRKLFVVLRQDGGIEEQAGEAYSHLLLTDEGQRLIQEAGFVPLRSVYFHN
ncbi:substrate-binding domain-containing protein [Chroococcus sp. FPU101]|uniref:substrate-binding domain-containing protein n=1 Tax=Chroococcus sp. FPU101 TaxID=1974212 RepID=UPI001A8C2833|nr:substrate-binding domain-containing protein [Chroococcus sp. FPU101]GFE71329.1 hypothetical protein CFPU101_39390 [Chroococcus sp. FPU101]